MTSLGHARTVFLAFSTILWYIFLSTVRPLCLAADAFFVELPPLEIIGFVKRKSALFENKRENGFVSSLFFIFARFLGVRKEGDGGALVVGLFRKPL